MPFHHYDSIVIADMATGRPLVGVRAILEDAETGAVVQAFRGDAPVQLVTGAHGLIPAFQTEETTRYVTITAGPVRLNRWCVELVGAAGQAITELERLTTSHIDLDVDGVPYYSPGSTTIPVQRDTDGTPYLMIGA